MSDRLYVATRKGLFTIDRAGDGRWSVSRTAFLGDPVSIVMADPRDGAVYAALKHGHFGSKVHRSDDAGATWTEVGTPEYPALPEGVEPRPNPMSGKVIPWKLKLIWALEPAGDDRPGALWCGTLPGGLFHSTDRGATWTMNEPLWNAPQREGWFGGGYDEPGIHSLCVDPRNSDDVILGVSCGGAWRTTDGGASWTNHSTGMRAEYMPPDQAYDVDVQDPHLVAQCRAQPDVLWVQHHNGIFRSTDRGANWSEITNVKPSAFGFAVAAHPTDPETAWFVPAVKDEHRIPVDGKLVVTRTRDGGATVESLAGGLPQEHAYDLVFRHALDVNATGERLAFGSTTGALWVSENGGDDWTTVSTHLPPVYAVRFG